MEIACSGGRSRTGTALACIAVLDGMPAERAVAFVRKHYARRAVETPWQRRYVTRFRSGGTSADSYGVSWLSSRRSRSCGERR